MSSRQKRLRVFAGPNGSGKSTIIDIVRGAGIDLGIYVNADDLKVILDKRGYVDFSEYGITVEQKELEQGLRESSFFVSDQVGNVLSQIRLCENKLYLDDLSLSDIFSTFIAEFIRVKLLGQCNKFSFETVMSHPGKLEYIKQAHSKGYKVYLYFVALEDPSMNIDRVASRVLQNGHNVPAEKIESRYYRTLNSLTTVIPLVDIAFFFDNSAEHPILFGKYENKEIEIIEPNLVPLWFHNYVLNYFLSDN